MKSIDLMDLFLQINKAEQNINYLERNMMELNHILRDMEQSSRLKLLKHMAQLRDLRKHLRTIGDDNKPF